MSLNQIGKREQKVVTNTWRLVRRPSRLICRFLRRHPHLIWHNKSANQIKWEQLHHHIIENLRWRMALILSSRMKFKLPESSSSSWLLASSLSLLSSSLPLPSLSMDPKRRWRTFLFLPFFLFRSVRLLFPSTGDSCSYSHRFGLFPETVFHNNNIHCPAFMK